MWQAAAVSSPALPRPAMQLAVVAGRQGRWDDAITWTTRAVALTTADARHAWVRPYLCRQIATLTVLAPDPPAFSLECAF